VHTLHTQSGNGRKTSYYANSMQAVLAIILCFLARFPCAHCCLCSHSLFAKETAKLLQATVLKVRGQGPIGNCNFGDVPNMEIPPSKLQNLLPIAPSCESGNEEEKAVRNQVNETYQFAAI